MKALILNSGIGRRMGILTKEHPKCMVKISQNDTILSRQLRLLSQAGVTNVVMTIGYLSQTLVNYCQSLDIPLNFTFINNPLYSETNYIYSIYCARESVLDDDILLLHGDLVFESSVLMDIINSEDSCMKVSSTLSLPDKDFKAVVNNGIVKAVGVEFFNSAIEAQALYKLKQSDWKIWLNKLCEFCDEGNRQCYAEVALNQVIDQCIIKAIDVGDRLCMEIDTPKDLNVIRKRIYVQ